MKITNLLFAFVFCLTASYAVASAPSCTLQPLRAMDIEYIVPEPSGISFCNSTGTLFAISDDDHAIFELNLEGQIIRTIFLDKKVKNIEAVTCDDVNQLLIITEEKKAKVTSYKLNNYNLIGGRMEAIYVDSFTLKLPDHMTSDSGFEGITIDTTTGHFIIANEKEPRVIMEVTRKGVIVDYYMPDYCEDLSDLEYESSSDILWVTSDMSKTVMATNRTTGELIDSWNIPVRNSEGIAVTNDKIYVLTDPSSKKSAQYVGGLLIFAKPVIGTGLQGGVCSGDEFSSEECVGCDLFFGRAKDNKKAFKKQEHEAVVHHREVEGAKFVALAVIGCVATIAVVLLFAVVLRVRRNFLVRRNALSSSLDDEESFDAGNVALSHSIPSTSLEIVV